MSKILVSEITENQESNKQWNYLEMDDSCVDLLNARNLEETESCTILKNIEIGNADVFIVYTYIKT